MAVAWGEFTGYPGGLRRGVMPSPISPRSPVSLGDVDAGGCPGLVGINWCLLHPPADGKK